jgi:hypothetical protein
MTFQQLADSLVCDRPGCLCRQPSRKGRLTRHCPGHTDEHPSLSVTEQGGKLLVHCHAGCPQDAIIGALRERGLWPKPGPAPDGEQRQIVATYDYLDESGRLLFQVVRYAPKGFSQRSPDGQDGWVWNLEGVRRVLYRLPELIKADPNDPVFVPEGEKDCDRLAGLGLVATTNSGGAGKWRRGITRSFGAAGW